MGACVQKEEESPSSQNDFTTARNIPKELAVMNSLKIIVPLRSVYSFLRPALRQQARSFGVSFCFATETRQMYPTFISIDVRGFKSTPHCAFAKKKKGGGKGKGGDDDDDEDAPAPPDVKDIEAQMDKRIAYLREEFSRMHSNRVTKDMFNVVMVEAYGSKSPIPECGQVSVQTASKVVINVFDAGLVPAVTKALRDCGLNLNPTAEGTVVTVPVPKASKEKREDTVKLAKKAGEKVQKQCSDLCFMLQAVVCCYRTVFKC